MKRRERFNSEKQRSCLEVLEVIERAESDSLYTKAA